MAKFHEYGPNNPEPPTKMLGNRRVIDTVKLKERQDAERAAQVQASAPTPRRPAGETTEYRAGSSPRLRQSIARLSNIETPAESTLDQHIARHDALQKMYAERDARLEREKQERERVRQAHAAENERRKLMLAEEAERKRQEAVRQNAALVDNMNRSQFWDVAKSYNLSETDTKLAYQRVIKNGHQSLPMMFDVEIQAFIAARDEAFGRK